MAKFKNPIAYFWVILKIWLRRIYENLNFSCSSLTFQGETDYRYLPSSVPALLAPVDIGHIGSYCQNGGGRMGKAVVPVFRWQLKGDQCQKTMFCNPKSAAQLTSIGFSIQSKNGFY
jgi:hypothetical protein